MRNVFEKTINNQSNRIVSLPDANLITLSTIEAGDLPPSVDESEIISRGETDIRNPITLKALDVCYPIFGKRSIDRLQFIESLRVKNLKQNSVPLPIGPQLVNRIQHDFQHILNA